MVVSINCDLYTPFPPGMLPEEGQSSEDGSGFHSPVFPSYPQIEGGVRYHPDQLVQVEQAAILGSQYEYQDLNPSNSLHSDAAGELHNLTSQQSQFRSEFPLPPRCHLGLELAPLQSNGNPRLPPPPSQGGPVHFSIPSTSSRPFIQASSRDHLILPVASNVKTELPMDGEEPFSPSTERAQSALSSDSLNTSREVKDIPPVIACQQCRARKIRCDSVRPVCNNCIRRSNVCVYDAAPKRRGPDKRPGTRQRSCKKRPADGSAPPPPSKRKRTTPADERYSSTPQIRPNKKISPATSSPIEEHYGIRMGQGAPGENPSSVRSIPLPPEVIKQERSPAEVHHPPHVHPAVSLGPPTSNVQPLEGSESFSDPQAFSLDSHASVWWDDLLRTYSVENIMTEFSDLVDNTTYHLSFINTRLLRRQLFDTDERLKIQPSFILAGLAIALLLKSSEIEPHAPSFRHRAKLLCDRAKSALAWSWDKRWVDSSLAEAALLLAFYESSASPEYHPDRLRDSIMTLDSIVRSVSLTTLDADDPMVSIFQSNCVPAIDTQSSYALVPNGRSQNLPMCCSCPEGQISDGPISRTPSYSWDVTHDDDGVRKEHLRRLCWSALGLVTSHSFQCLSFSTQPPDLFMSDPANFSLLFPGEAVGTGHGLPNQTLSAKESIWSLYCRSMLLWNFSTRLQASSLNSNQADGELALKASAEAQAILTVLDVHKCRLNLELVSISREYLYHTQMMITQWFRRFVRSPDNGPSMNRQQTTEWRSYEVWNQDQLVCDATSALEHIHESKGRILTRQPYLVGWFASRIAMCLSSWNDNHFLETVDQAKSMLVVLEALTTLWPGPWQQRQTQELRDRLSDACVVAASPLPPRTELLIPPPLRTI